MESLQPSPASKGMMSSAVTETCTQLSVPVTAWGREGHPSHRSDPSGNSQNSEISLMLGLPSFSCFSLQLLPCIPAWLEPHSLSWSLCLPAWFGTWESLGLFCQIFSPSSFFGGVACRDLEFLSPSGLESSGWLYPHKKAALTFHTSSTNDHGFCPLCKDKLYLPLNFSLLFLS